MARYIPPKLSDGIRPFLDDERAVSRHFSHGFDDWEEAYLHKYLTREWDLQDLADYMGIKRYKTVSMWIKQYKKEKGLTP